ncbi:MAG: zinc ribbon domain-containing protein [Eubacteriales bacterium]|nr:zinc ribbon domain-containing protein [Eubacteriales bacterium]
MREIFRCQKCGKVFTVLDKTGPDFGMSYTYHADETICSHCGGNVIWVDEYDEPLSGYRKMEKSRRGFKLVCLFTAIAVIMFVLWLIFIK